MGSAKRGVVLLASVLAAARALACAPFDGDATTSADAEREGGATAETDAAAGCGVGGFVDDFTRAQGVPLDDKWTVLGGADSVTFASAASLGRKAPPSLRIATTSSGVGAVRKVWTRSVANTTDSGCIAFHFALYVEKNDANGDLYFASVDFAGGRHYMLSLNTTNHLVMTETDESDQALDHYLGARPVDPGRWYDVDVLAVSGPAGEGRPRLVVGGSEAPLELPKRSRAYATGVALGVQYAQADKVSSLVFDDVSVR